jgi:hypothetical protein
MQCKIYIEDQVDFFARKWITSAGIDPKQKKIARR